MRTSRLPAIVAVIATACAGAHVADAGLDDAGADAGEPSRCRTSDGGLARLGLNDVSILVPLSANLSPPAQLIPRGLYDRLVLDAAGMPLTIDNYARLQVVAVRFDLCDRVAKGPCPAGDARLRLVLQPVEQTQTRDTAFHAFYAVPAAAVPQLLSDLEQLAALQGTALNAPLGVSPALAAEPAGAYAQKLAALLAAHCTPGQLTRLTFFTQPDFFAQVRWVFRGVERDPAGNFADVAIPSAPDAGEQHVFLGSAGYEATPLADEPPAFRVVISAQRFAAASEARRAEGLRALAEVENPLERSIDSLQCVTCHVSTVLGQLRAGSGPGESPYSSSWNLSIDGGGSPATDRSLRAFGWFHDQPMISRRVVHETAQVLTELAACR